MWRECHTYGCGRNQEVAGPLDLFLKRCTRFGVDLCVRLVCHMTLDHTAARLICKVPKFHHITPSLIELHWLPIKQRIIYKTLVLTYKSTHNEGPQYLADLLHVKQPSRQLRSSNQRQLIVPRVRTVRYGERSFAFAAPRLWNGLEHHVHDSTTIHIFKKSLKTILFKRAYDV